MYKFMSYGCEHDHNLSCDLIGTVIHAVLEYNVLTNDYWLDVTSDVIGYDGSERYICNSIAHAKKVFKNLDKCVLKGLYRIGEY